MRPRRRRSILVIGQPRSGTTALYSAIKQAGAFTCLHEPSRADEFQRFQELPARRKLTKVLSHTFWSHLGGDADGFSHRVLIHRDPRDVVVSWLLYRPLLRDNWRNRAFIDEFLELLDAKERDPAGVSLLELHAVFARYAIHHTTVESYQRFAEMDRRFVDRYPDTVLCSYDALNDGQFERLDRYLGLRLPRDATLSAHVEHNLRARRSGTWRHWFTPRDVEAFRVVFDPVLTELGYETSWELASVPSIAPDESSGYVRRHLASMASRPSAYGRLRGPEAYTESLVRALSSAAEDGKEGALIESALLALAGWVGPPDHRRARRLLTEAAERGSHTAYVHLVLGDRSEVLPARHPTQLMEAAVALRGQKETEVRMARYAEVWAMLATRAGGRPDLLRADHQSPARPVAYQ